MDGRVLPKIGIDFHVAGGIYQGVKTYLANLLEEILGMDDTSTYIIYADAVDTFDRWRAQYPNVRIKKLPTQSGRLNLLAGFPATAFRDRLALFHSQYVLPMFLPCPSVLTIHDILFESHPEFFPRTHRHLLKFFIPFSARRANRIISVSEFTKNEIIMRYGISEKKVKVIHEGASGSFVPIKNREIISVTLKRYGIKKKYILFVGRIEPRKNIAGLLRAFDFVKQRGKKDLCVVIVGQQDAIFKENELAEMISEMKLSTDVLFTGGVSEEDLGALYNGAELLVYPAFAEGFGLPVLEAMACGTPVITSNVTSLPEVAGDAAILVNPNDFKEIGRKLEMVLGDDRLRRRLSQKGMQRARAFSWTKAAEDTVKLYYDVLNCNGK